MSVESILAEYLKQYPFGYGGQSANRDRYHWLAAFLRSIEAGDDDETLVVKYDGKIDRETGEFLKRQIEK